MKLKPVESGFPGADSPAVKGAGKPVPGQKGIPGAPGKSGVLPGPGLKAPVPGGIAGPAAPLIPEKPGPVPAVVPAHQPAADAPHPLKALIQSLGLPLDDLSASLLGFIRYFSLPQEPGLLGKLRREVLLSARGPAKTGREAAALAAAAAADKGLNLDPEALGEYAAAIDPGFSGGEPAGEDSAGDKRQGRGRQKAPRPGEIQEMAEESLGKDPVMGLINRLPGREGRRWIVLPLKPDRCRVSVRVLLKGNAPPFQAERLAVDICTKERRWLFTFDDAGLPSSRVEIAVTPPLPRPGLAALERELQRHLVPWAGRIRVREGELPDFFADSRDEALLSVNQAV